MAQIEAHIISGFGLQHIHSLQHKNIHPTDISSKILRDQENLLVKKWDEATEMQTKMLLVASGKRWTAVLKDWQVCWCALGVPYIISYRNLTHKVKQQTVYTMDSRNMIDENKNGKPHDDLQRALMAEKTAVRFLGVAGEISELSAAAGSRVNLSIKAPNISILCCSGTGAATCCSSLSRLLNWKTGFCLKFAGMAPPCTCARPITQSRKH